MIEYAIIKLFIQDQSLYDRYYKYLKIDDFIKINYPLLNKLFKCFPANSLEELEAKYLSMFPTIKTGDREALSNLINQIRESLVNESIVSLLESHRKRALANDMAMVALDVAEGKKSPEEIDKIYQKFEFAAIEELAEEDYVSTDIEELFSEEELEGGLFWPLKCLNQSLGPLRKGNLGHIFARVETGKTAMWISVAVHMAQQIKEDEHIVIFFNEEQGKDTIFRMYSNLTNMSYMELANNIKSAKKMWKEKIGNRIKFIDNPALVEKRAIENILTKLNPRLILVDNADKTKGFTADRKDLTLHEIYKWYRELAKTYCPVITVGQADSTSHNSKILDESQMADSKTGKPSELDFIIGIGRIDKEGYEDVRYLSLPKNKLRGNKDTIEGMRHMKGKEVILNPSLSKYEDV